MTRIGELTATFARERHVFQNGTPERTIIGSTDDGKTIKGRAQELELVPGLTYLFLGRWVNHDRFGEQFCFRSFCEKSPVGQRAITKYLESAPGIGPAVAQRLWEAFGEKAIEEIREQPAFVGNHVKRWSAEAALKASKYFHERFNTEQLTLALTSLLDGGGFPADLAKRLRRDLGAKAPETVKANPYYLLRYKGVGFAKADTLYKKLGLPLDAIERQARCVWHCANEANGDTWIPLAEAERFIDANVDSAKSNIREAIAWGVENDLVRERDGCVAEASRADAETRLASSVAEAICEADDELGFTDEKKLKWPPIGAVRGLSNHQRKELFKATRGVVGLLTGAPGCGKTYTLGRLVQRLINAGKTFALCAPTGKAAVRISESLSQMGVNVKARTIHSLLGVEETGEDGAGWKFRHRNGNPLELDFILIDEPSMVDTSLMASLFAARHRGCHVLMFGDPHQLSPVGHGAPFRDLIRMVPTGHLTEPRRNSGRIVRTCLDIRERHTFTPSEALDLEAETPENLVVVRSEEADHAMLKLEQILDGATRRGMDRVWDVQPIVPINDNSPVSRHKLNERLQNFLNPKGETVDGHPFRVGDKVVCLKNDNFKVDGRGRTDPLEVNDSAEARVMNGEQGRVLHVDPKCFVVQVGAPDRCVIVRHGEVKDQSRKPGNFYGWDLGYAISCHKSQGSEWPIVVVMIDDSGAARRVCSREWVTTAISRAKVACFCIGKKEVVSQYVLRSSLWQRKTFLCEKVNEALVKNGTACEEERAMVEV